MGLWWSVEYLRYQHLNSAVQEEPPATDLVDGDDGDQGGNDVDDADDDCRHEGGLTAETHGLIDQGGVEHDYVNARQLLEERDEDGHGELGAVLPLHYDGPGVPDFLAPLVGRHEVPKFQADVVDAADQAQRGLGFLGVAALDEGVGRLGEDQRADGDDGGRDAGERQADSPPPRPLYLVGEVVDDVGDEDADGDHELEHDVQHSAEPWRCDLGEIDRHRLQMEAKKKGKSLIT